MSDPIKVAPDEVRWLLERRDELEFLASEVGPSDERDEELAMIDDALDAAKAQGLDFDWPVD